MAIIAVADVITETTMTTTTHNSPHMDSLLRAAHHQQDSPQQEMLLPTLMLFTAVTRIIWPCGMLHLRNNSSKEAKALRPRLRRPTVVGSDIDAHDAEISSIDACINDAQDL